MAVAVDCTGKINPLKSFLQHLPSYSDEDIKRRFQKGMACLYEDAADKSESIQSRRRLARQHLSTIRMKFGDGVYYLCMFASSVKVLGNNPTGSGFDEAVAAWPGKEQIPSDFAERARKIIDGCLAEKENGITRPSHNAPSQKQKQKRTRPTLHVEEQGGNAENQAMKRARLDGTSGVMSDHRSISNIPKQYATTRHNLPRSSEPTPANRRNEVNVASVNPNATLASYNQHQSNTGNGDKDSFANENGNTNPRIPTRMHEHLATPQDIQLAMQQYPKEHFNVYRLDKEDIYRVLAFYKGPISLVMPLYPGSSPQITIECSWAEAKKLQRDQVM